MLVVESLRGLFSANCKLCLLGIARQRDSGRCNLAWIRRGTRDLLSSRIIIMQNFYSSMFNTRCHSITHGIKFKISKKKIWIDSSGNGREPREEKQF